MKIYIKNALMALVCAVMAVSVLTGCKKESAEKNELRGTQWVAILEYDEEMEWSLATSCILTFDDKVTLKANIMWYEVAVSFSYDYDKPAVTFSNGELVLDGDSAIVWALIAQESDISLNEIQAKLKQLTFTATVSGNTLVFPEDFFDGNLVFTKVK